MVKVCVSFKNSLFVWVYLKEVCFFRGCFYLVFILQNFGSLAPLIFFKQLFLSKSIFSLRPILDRAEARRAEIISARLGSTWHASVLDAENTAVLKQLY